MRVLVGVLIAVVVVVSISVAAQSPGAGANPVTQSIRNGWNGAKQNIAGSAKVMPEDKYGFKPVPTVRSFGEILAHIAGAHGDERDEVDPAQRGGVHEQRAPRDFGISALRVSRGAMAPGP